MGKGDKRRPEAEVGSFEASMDRMIREGGLAAPSHTHSLDQQQQKQSTEQDRPLQIEEVVDVPIPDGC